MSRLSEYISVRITTGSVYNNKDIVACLLKTRILKVAETAVAREQLCKRPLQWLSSRHLITAIDTHALMEDTFIVRSLSGLAAITLQS
jgi:hypothetical protein